MIDVTLKDKQIKKELEYPCLKICKPTGRIVLFVAPKEGFELVSRISPSTSSSRYSTTWDEAQLQPYNGVIEIQNRKE